MQGSPRIDELRQKFHENPRRYFGPLANEYRKAGDPEQAIAICRAHLAQQPGHMSGHVIYAQALYDAKRTDEARGMFEKALSLDPDNAIVLRYLGDIAREKGDSGEAKHWYSRALDADPNNKEIAAYLAELAEPLTEAASHEAQAASEDREAFGEQSKPAPYSRRPSLGDQEAEERGTAAAQPEHAEPLEETARRTPPPNEGPPFATRTMAELYAKQGYRDVALDVYRQLALEHPDDKEISDRLEELELSSGDSWDKDPWGAGFSGDDASSAEFETPDIPASPTEPDTSPETPADAGTLLDEAKARVSASNAVAPVALRGEESDEPPEALAEEEHFVAYSPQLPEEKDLPHYAPRKPTVREFFATLGTFKPPAREGAAITARAAVSRMAPQPADYPLATDAFANLFGNAPVNREDSRAAFALSGALAASTPAPSPPAPVDAASIPVASPAPAQESEEDIRKFREWLDGLTES